MTITTKNSLRFMALSVFCLAAAGCASTGPAEPTVGVMPGKGKAYATFQREDAYCQATARNAIGNQSPGEVANNTAVTNAAVGTGLGALAGAAIGSLSGNMGAGAAVGAGTGLVAGSVVGAGNANEAGGSVQARYDTVYAQCMSASGNQIERPAPPPPPPVVVYERPEPVYVYPRYRRW